VNSPYSRIGMSGRLAVALAAVVSLLALARPAWPDALASQDNAALQQTASAIAPAASPISAPTRPEPQRSGPAALEGAEDWGKAGQPLQSHMADALFGIPMPWGEEHFEAMRASYLTPDGKKWLAAIMARAKPYLPYIEERIRFYGLPDELAFLPVIESEFSPRNISRSGAAGLWQFMRNSIGGYGMRIDDWVDERRDFMKSTDGALRKLADNYATFGDWNLALAAYNCGDGAIARAIAKAKKDGTAAPDYWDLRKGGFLKGETAGYVPKFLAVASILRYPGRNGLVQSWEEPAEWEAVAPGRPVDLKLLSEQAGLSLAVLREANPELRYGVTPPGSSYELKVPAAAASAVRAVVEDPSRKLIRYYLHTVRSGDTLSGIARRYGTPMPTIASSNPGLRPDSIRLGQVIVVPALKDAPPPEPEVSAGEAPAFSSSYVVAKGDTLWSISLRYEVHPELLAERNGLNLSSVIREGMTLRVPILKPTP
jgi:membrane-bound lytic murein transglycosylase D